MRTASQVFSSDTKVGDALGRARSAKSRTWLVTDPRGVVGVVSLALLEQSARESGGKRLEEILDPAMIPHVHADQGLEVALERMGTNHIDLLPVVSRADVRQLEGVVNLSDVLDSYGVKT